MTLVIYLVMDQEIIKEEMAKVKVRGIGTGDGPDTGGGMGDGKGRQVIGNPELANPKNWEGFVMVQFIIDASGNVISTKVLKVIQKLL